MQSIAALRYYARAQRCRAPGPTAPPSPSSPKTSTRGSPSSPSAVPAWSSTPARRPTPPPPPPTPPPSGTNLRTPDDLSPESSLEKSPRLPGRRRRLRGRVPEPRRRGTSRGVYHRPRFTVVVRHRARLAALRERRLRPDENAGARGGIVPLDDVRRRADASVVLEFGSFFERFRVRRFLVALGRARVPIVGRRVRRGGGSPACFVVTREHVSSGIDVVAARLRRRDLDGRRWVGEEPRDW